MSDVDDAPVPLCFQLTPSDAELALLQQLGRSLGVPAAYVLELLLRSLVAEQAAAEFAARAQTLQAQTDRLRAVRNLPRSLTS